MEQLSYQVIDQELNGEKYPPSVADKLSSMKPSFQDVNTGLGWLSLVLGASEVVFTRSISRMAGLDEKYAPLLRVFGIREITSGMGLLRGQNKKAWLGSRVAGDVLDGAFLAWTFINEKDAQKRKRIALMAAIVAPVVALDIVNLLREQHQELSPFVEDMG